MPSRTNYRVLTVSVLEEDFLKSYLMFKFQVLISNRFTFWLVSDPLLDYVWECL